MLAVGIDTGGTFTDLVQMEDGTLKTYKVPSTPSEPAEALLAGLRELLGRALEALGSARFVITHGSTVATNALLERKGARVALLTTAGFEDVLEIGRQNRPSLYDFNVDKPAPLVTRENIFGVNERVLYDGTVERRPDPREIEEIARKVVANGCDSIAVCFLHSYRNSENEQNVAGLLADLHIPLCASHQVLPEYREYERFSATSVNAFVSPVMDAYVGHIEQELPDGARLRVMQSNGGSISAARARAEAVQTILSGPAAGVVGAFEAARTAGFERVITFDMGGTSTDVSLCDGSISTRTNSTISAIPIAVPIVDIHTVGAGGGSIAWLDPAGSLHVGPQSAGALPGPVCYGKSSDLTVTDANLFLGRMLPDHFLGGRIWLDLDRVRRRMLKFANHLGMPAERAAEGILKVADATMERAIRVISVERGHDPRRFALVAFGGAGPMHACSLARALAIPNVLIPRNAGVLSAFGLLMADVKKDFSRTILIGAEEADIPRLNRFLAPLEAQALSVLADEGFAPDEIALERFIDMRYVGQSYEVTVPATKNFLPVFHREHLRLYGHSDSSRKVELVNVRVSARGIIKPPKFPRYQEVDEIADSALLGPTHHAVFEEKTLRAPVYERAELRAGNRIPGPAIIVETNATTVVAPDFAAKVDAWGNLLLTARRAHEV
jgi:N-methylhydantoinase A/oxoprolinase/acetone carboxylase beta subunit